MTEIVIGCVAAWIVLVAGLMRIRQLRMEHEAKGRFVAHYRPAYLERGFATLVEMKGTLVYWDEIREGTDPQGNKLVIRVTLCTTVASGIAMARAEGLDGEDEEALLANWFFRHRVRLFPG